MSISVENTAGVSWGAIIAGAACAAALSFILLILGFGLGLSAVSPWSNTGASLATIGVSSIIWVAFTQIAASGLGGYLAGRLRVRWAGVHSDEVYFRDTAHGMTAWAVSTLAAAVLLTSTLTTVMSGGVRAGAEVVGGAAEVLSTAGDAADSYFSDALLRPAPNSQAETASDSVRAEISTIFLRSLSENELSTNDSQYMASVISRYTGVSQQAAETRITQIRDQAQQAALQAETAAREAADAARKSASYSALWMFIALLCGAFFASLMATFGGRQRDSDIYDPAYISSGQASIHRPDKAI
ncbi:MAG: hypothetical protein Q7W55_06570 [Pseudohongiella sp.]|nr:hypothetical protein [Pseudohongiella sp.]MDO9520633.1 hypothetical protein [Pseudohongiella sp.]MDP2127903.1 hypothetical protein [Pseudohongiella sp.]